MSQIKANVIEEYLTRLGLEMYVTLFISNLSHGLNERSALANYKKIEQLKKLQM